MKKLAAASAFAALLLLSSNAFAWFEICNTKSNGADMYVTYAYYQPSTTTLYTDACGSFTRVFSPRYYTAWKNTGWWHLYPNQCGTVYGPALTNTWGYVYAQVSDGSLWSARTYPSRLRARRLELTNTPTDLTGPAMASAWTEWNRELWKPGTKILASEHFTNSPKFREPQVKHLLSESGQKVGEEHSDGLCFPSLRLALTP